VLAKFIIQMLRGEPVTIHGDGAQSRDFVYVENAVEANLLAAKAPACQVAGRVFNVATGRRVDLNQTFRILKRLTGYKGEAQHGPERAGDVKHSVADTSRGEQDLGFRAKVDFEEGLRRTIAWYRTQENANAL
jgi:UDP-glucose 4-epimerase